MEPKKTDSFSAKHKKARNSGLFCAWRRRRTEENPSVRQIGRKADLDVAAEPQRPEGARHRDVPSHQLAYASWNVIGHADDGPQAARSRRARRNAPSNPSPAAIARLVESAPATAGFSLFGGECLPDATELGPATAVPSLRKLPASGCSCAITERDFACDSAQAFPRGKLFEFEVHPEHAR